MVAPIVGTGKTGSGPFTLLIHELSLLQIAVCHCVCVYGQHNPGPLHSMDASLYIIFSLLLYNSLEKRHAAIAERAHGKGTWRRSGVLKNLRAEVYGVSPPWLNAMHTIMIVSPLYTPGCIRIAIVVLKRGFI